MHNMSKVTFQPFVGEEMELLYGNLESILIPLKMSLIPFLISHHLSLKM